VGKDPISDEVEVELICPHCGYHTMRAASRLCRKIKIVCANCGADLVVPDDWDEDDGDEEAS
jgi:predicted RNA-binding Zn-ribbon protein involved in translation (DUF1610 family)